MTVTLNSIGGRKSVGLALVALAFGLWLLFVDDVGELPLTDPDEGRYAEIGREMLAGGDWVTPHLFGMPYLEKPPLLYWLTALSFRELGTNEFAARLAPTLAATVGVLATGAFAAGVFGPLAGVSTTLVLGTSVLYLVIARTVLTDMLFSTGMTIALLSFLWARIRAEPRAFAVAWIGLAVAVLSKGPAAIVLCGLVVAADSMANRSWRWLRSVDFWMTAPLFVVLAAPWFMIIQEQHHQYASFYLWKEHLSRAAGSEHARPFYFYLPILLGGFLPWTPFAIAAAPSWVREARTDSPDASVVRFLLLWAAVVFVVFSAAVGKLPTYILPMFAPLALLVGRTLAARDLRIPLAAAAVAVLVYKVGADVAPRIADSYTAHREITELADRIGADDEVAMFGGYFPSIAFYLRRTPLLVGVRQELRFGRSLEDSRAFVGDLAALRDAAPHGHLYFLTDAREKRADELRDALGPIELIDRNQAAALWVRTNAVQ